MSIDPKSNVALEVSDEAEYMDKLRNTPIAELADYIGIDIDLTIQLRIELITGRNGLPVCARQRLETATA